ncbi:hypothetical protein SVIOM342S_07100 [Streptomyces violaceorubidus]
MARVQPAPPRASDVLMMALVAGNFSLVSGSSQAGMSTRVSRGMLTTAALLRSAARWISICTSASGGLSRWFLPPPSATLASEARLSEPSSRMFRGVCPAAFGSLLCALESPLLRSPLSMLPFRCW